MSHFPHFWGESKYICFADTCIRIRKTIMCSTYVMSVRGKIYDIKLCTRLGMLQYACPVIWNIFAHVYYVLIGATISTSFLIDNVIIEVKIKICGHKSNPWYRTSITVKTIQTLRFCEDKMLYYRKYIVIRAHT